MKEVTFLNLANVPKATFVKVLGKIKQIGPVMAKKITDAVYVPGATTDWATEVEDGYIDRVREMLDEEGINYSVKDLPQETTVSPALSELTSGGTGTYLESTEMGIRVIFVAHVPDDKDLARKAKGLLKDAKCAVFAREITSHDKPAIRIEASKIFCPGIRDLDSILEFVNGVSSIFTMLMDIRDLDARKKRLDNRITEAFDKISW